jgi:cytochrome P450
MFQAGHDTTASLISRGTLALLRHPNQLARLRENEGLMENATEELLRYDTSVQLSLNFAVADVLFHGRTIRNADAVIILRGAANRDPARFPSPDRLDLEHHSFGLGAHFCLGASLARLEIQEAIGGLVRRLPGLHVDPDAAVYRPSLHLHGLASIPVEW